MPGTVLGPRCVERKEVIFAHLTQFFEKQAFSVVWDPRRALHSTFEIFDVLRFFEIFL